MWNERGSGFAAWASGLWIGALLVTLTTVCCVEKAKVGECQPGMIYCEGDIASICQADSLTYKQIDCRDEDKVCHPGRGCVNCHPATFGCIETTVGECKPDGSGLQPIHECAVAVGEVCYLGQCVEACAAAADQKSYIGCEYWAVDLDNATISETENAAAQQYAVVISNVGLIEAEVTVYKNTAPVGWPPAEQVVAQARVAPDGLHVFKLPSREVDGSHSGLTDNGTHTFLSSNAYRIVSTVPIVAYQFNPLQNVQVFSNDASILVPTSVLDTQYLVLGWPQTIADTENPQTDFHRNLRAFLTVVGTEPGTDVEITVSTDTVGSTDIAPATAGDTIRVELGPYDVLNLETGSFNADFTGTQVVSDKPVAVFSGNEASDVPFFDTLTTRRCCADHLEHQQLPESSAGTDFVAARMPPRTPAVAAAGGDVSITDEPEYFRLMALRDNTVIQTNLDPPDDVLLLDRGEHTTLEAWCDFEIKASKPIFVGQFMASQQNTGIPIHVLPGGDPSYLLLAPKQQWRSRYVFLTPDKYAFDFIVVVAPSGTELLLDGSPMPESCTVTRAECPGQIDPTTDMMIWRCQLSFPKIIDGLPPPDNIDPNNQNDGYHILEGSEQISLVAYGFDERVSYAYIGGTDVRRINVE
jgi:hypothetical protein